MSHVLPMYLLCFWTWEHFSCVAVYGGSESSAISSKIYVFVPKMNKGLTALERHEGE